MRMQRCTTLEIVLLNSRERTAGKEEGATEGFHRSHSWKPGIGGDLVRVMNESSGSR